MPEHLIFRGHPALPFLLVPPAIGFWLERHAAEHALETAGLFALGVLAWTLIEYAMHRFLFHAPLTSRTGRVLTFVVHGHHHVTPGEPSRLAATPVQLASLALLVSAFWHLTLGPARVPILMAGTMSGYLAYEALHHLAHHERAPTHRLLRALARHHLRHHHEAPDACWGISTPLWDWIFRTHR